MEHKNRFKKNGKHKIGQEELKKITGGADVFIIIAFVVVGVVVGVDVGAGRR